MVQKVAFIFLMLWIVMTKHIITHNILPCTDIPIPINKSAGLRVVVAALEIIQPRLRIQIVATIAEGVQVGNIVRTSKFLSVSVLYGDGIAPAVIEVPYPQVSTS